MSISQAQDINDALRYSTGEVEGSARFKAMSGAFGALGGDLSAVSINPAGSAIFTSSYASVTLDSDNNKNDVQYFNGNRNNTNSTINLSQGGGTFIFKSNNQDSKWKKIALSIAFDNTKNYSDNWNSNGTGDTSIGDYFLANAQGLRLDEISALPGESTSEAYSEIGNAFGFVNQQAFLGFDSFILEPANFNDDNTIYSSNIAGDAFNQSHSYAATGYNGKISFNIGTQYDDNLYLGLNLNSHFLNFERFTSFFETNNDINSTVTDVLFNNTLSTIGSGFSFQLGGIYKLTNEFRIGLTYDSPTWMTIEEQTTQYLETNRIEAGSVITQIVDPNIINVFDRYTVQTPSKLTGSLAYVFGTQGLISFDYSRRDHSQTKFKPTSDAFFSEQNTIIENALTSASTFKIGAEYKIEAFSLRGGYRLEESPYKDGTTIGDLNGYSLGLGYNFGNTTLDLAYSNAKQDINYQLFNVGLTDAARISNNNSNVALTLGFKL